MLHSLFHAFELETCLLDGCSDIGLGGGTGNDKRVSRRSSFARGDTLHFADRLLASGLAMVAMHALDGIDNRSRGHFLFLEFAEEFHCECNYDEQY